MAEQGSTGQSWTGRIAGLIVVAILVVGGYFALTTRQGPKPEQAVDVAIVPPSDADAPAKPAAPGAPAAEPAAAPAAPAPAANAPAPETGAPAASQPAAPATMDQAAAPATMDQAAAPAPATPAPSAPDASAAPGNADTASAPEAAVPSEPAAAANPAEAPSAEASAQPPASAPAAPEAGPPAADAAGLPVAPSFDVVRVEPSGEAVVAGLAPPNSTVEVLADSMPIAKGQANERGEWAMTTDAPLPPGAHDLSIRTTSPDRKTETLSEQSVAVNVPDSPRSQPLVVLNNPEGASKILQVPAPDKPAAPGAAVAKPAVTVDAVEFQDGKLYISGSAAIGGTVRIYVDGVVVGDATVGEDGRWLIETKREVGSGQHVVRADRIDKETGSVVARAEVPFEQNGDVATLMSVSAGGGGSGGAASAGNAPELKSVIIRRGDNLWTISKRLYGHGVRFSTIYEANNDQIRDPDLIYPGQVFLLPVGDSRWKD